MMIFLAGELQDVEELHQWHVQKADAHPCFAPVPREESVRSTPLLFVLFSVGHGPPPCFVFCVSGDWVIYRCVWVVVIRPPVIEIRVE